MAPPTPTTPVTTTTTTAAPVWGGDSVVDCSRQDGLYPDPNNCRGFIKCAQVTVTAVNVTVAVSVEVVFVPSRHRSNI